MTHCAATSLAGRRVQAYTDILSRSMVSIAPLRHSVKARVTLSMLSIFLVSLWSLSYYASQVLREDTQRLLGEQQFSTATYMAAEVNHELADRFEALKIVADGISPAMLSNPTALQAHLDLRVLLHRLFNGGVLAYRLDGTAVAEAPLSAKRVGINYMDIDTIAAALRDGKSTIGRPVMGKKLLAPVFGMTVPMRDAQGKVIGALTGVTNLGTANFLDVITNGRYGRTGGYLLVAPQHRMVVTATDKRRIMDRMPEPGSNPQIDRFAQGYEGTAVLTNPLGVPVLASARQIPVAGWYLSAALPVAEAFAPIHAMQRRMLLATLVLTLLAGGLTWWVIKRQLAPILSAAASLAAMSTSKWPPQPLHIARQDEIGQLIGGFNRLLATLAQREEALKYGEHKLSTILDNVDAFIYVKDTEGRYLFANRRLLELFGLPINAVIGHGDESFFDAPTVAQLRRNDRQVLTGGQTVKADETNLQLISGRTATCLSVKLPLRNDAGDIYALCGVSTDITARKQAEEERRIGAIAFECQEGMVVMDASSTILRVNHAFTQITGYSQQDAQGQTSAILRSDRHPASFYEGHWREARSKGSWRGEIWFRRKNGEVFCARVAVTAVTDDASEVTHYVGNLSDATGSQLQEQQRLANEASHRDALVREVHHRIKNNLQGIIGILRQFAQQHPQTAEPINQAIGQVQGIAVIHGLRGRADPSAVQLCELTSVIAAEVSALWQTPIQVDLPQPWAPCTLAEQEAVPMALVLNELLVNAVKHGGKVHGDTCVSMKKGENPDHVLTIIRNTGTLPSEAQREALSHVGLKLVRSLLPRNGAELRHNQVAHLVVTELEIRPPIISMKKDDTA